MEHATDEGWLLVVISCQPNPILPTEIIIDIIHLPYPKNRRHNTDLFSIPVFLPEHSFLASIAIQGSNSLITNLRRILKRVAIPHLCPRSDF